MKTTVVFSALALSLLSDRVAADGGLLIPLYTWPTIAPDGQSYKCVSEEFSKVATSVAAHKTIAIVNPNNGPGYGDDSWKKLSYDTCIAYLKDHGVEVIGYVHTKVGYPNIIGYRGFSIITRDIDQWYNEYDVDGIFIDEVTNRWPADWDSKLQAIPFYQDLVDYVLDLSYGRAVLNPGSAYFEDILAPYYGHEEVIVVLFESMQWNYQRDNCVWSLWTTAQGSFDQGPFCNYVPNWDGVEPLKEAMETGLIPSKQSAVMIYGATSTYTATSQSISFGTAAGVGWFYVTDRWDWAAAPSQDVMDWQAELVLTV